MCGISGYWSMAMAAEQGRRFLERACVLQRHRGPDEQAILQRDGLGFGFVRLAILDLQTGMQPLVHPSDETLIACNGQIYNYVELRRQLPERRYVTSGDMEVALNAYRHLGTAFVNTLNGMFAGVIHDPKRHCLLLFRDRFGIKPLYWVRTPVGFFYASEIRPLLQAPGVSVQLNRSALSTWFTYRYLPGTATLFEGIHRVPPASVLEMDTRTGAVSVASYWEWTFSPPDPALSFEAAQDEFVRLFEDAVRIRMRSDVEVGSFLSGGVDSSAVAAAALGHRPDLKLFTVGFEEADYDETADVEALVAAMPQRFFGAHRFVAPCGRDQLAMLPALVAAMEEPVSIGTLLPTYRVCQLAASHVKVVLTGEGADEIFAGYRKFRLEAAALAWPSASPSEQRALMTLYPELPARLSVEGGADPVFRHIDAERLFDRETLSALLCTPASADDALADFRTPALSGAPDSLGAMQLLESRTRLPDYVNLRLDRMSMCHALETRTPFLDVRLVEFAGSLPVSYRVNPLANQGKVLCREAFARHHLLPADVCARPKVPFTIPIADWFSANQPLPEPIAAIVRGREVDRQGILDGALVRRMAQQVTSRGVGPDTLVSMGDRIFAIVVFSLWYDAFMKGTS